MLSVLVAGAACGCVGGGSSPTDPGALDAAVAFGDAAAPRGPCDGGAGAGATCLARVEAELVDEDGAPLPARLVSVCGALCFYGTSGADGRVEVAVGEALPLADYSFLVHGRPDLAGYYAPLPPTDGASPAVLRYARALVVPRLPPDGPALALDGRAQDVESAGARLEIPAGLVVEPSVEDFVEGPIPFRARQVPQALWPPVVADGARPLALWALAPYEAALTPPADRKDLGARLTLPAPAGLAAGAVVELWALGSLLWPDGPAPGTLGRVGLATVSADGARLESDPSSPLRFLTWIALRPKGP